MGLGMNDTSSSRTGLFLIELVISIFFFIIACAVVIQVFVKSHMLTENTLALNNAVGFTRNISEFFLGNGGSFDCLKEQYCDTSVSLPVPDKYSDDYFCLLFDKDWNSIFATDNAKYCIIVVNYDLSADKYGALSCIDVYTGIYSGAISDSDSFDFESDYWKNNEIYMQHIEKYITEGDYCE